MKNRILAVLFIALYVTVLTGCSSSTNSLVGNPTEGTSSSYEKITGSKVKELINQNKNITILDVRTEEEYKAGHIEGSLLIPYDEISKKAENILKDKSSTIIVYCHSGRRSAIAAQTLSELGYSNIYDLGGISNWNYGVIAN